VSPEQTAFDAAVHEAIVLFELGEAMNQARFDELLAELEARRPELEAVPEDDPRAAKARDLQARANELERRAAVGHGQMDEVNTLLTPLMGKR
jgi:uncharacterized coiled-coil protein SlyX